jgi:hypothetical protein
MRAALTIGDFAQITHLSVKTLRHYHEAGLLEPAEVDPTYLIGPRDTDDTAAWRTEIGWPVFRTSAA